MLHRHFADRRVNRINLRREFFYADPAEVLEALREHKIAVVEFRTDAEAPEFRASQAYARRHPSWARRDPACRRLMDNTVPRVDRDRVAAATCDGRLRVSIHRPSVLVR